MQVDKISMGTVVDHIQAGKASKLFSLLGIGEDYPHRVAIVMHVPSKKMGTKDILKIEGKIVSEEMANLIALASPGASVNIIKDGKCEKKYEVALPKEVKNLGKCPNPNCISLETGTSLFSMDGDKRYRCHFCERLFKADELV